MTAILTKNYGYFPLLLLALIVALGGGAVLGFWLGAGLNTLLQAAFGLRVEGIAALGLPYLLALLAGASLAALVMTASVRQRGGFQGGHAAVSFLAIFGTIFTVNFTMATQAVRTFPGLEVANSYIASQSFDQRRAAQEALGWTVTAELVDDQLRLAFTDAGGPVFPPQVQAVIGRPTHNNDDQTLRLTRSGGALSAPVDLAPGLWMIRLSAEAADGTAFEQRLPVSVR